MSETDGREFLYTTSFLQCFVISMANLIVVLSIGRYEALRHRNSLIIIMALAFADTLNMFAYFTSGVYRIYVILSGQLNIPKSLVQCMLTPHCLLWSFSEHLASLMLIVVSLDRLMAIFCPLQYIGWPRYYSYSLIAVAYVFHTNKTVHGFCYSGEIFRLANSRIFTSYFESSPQCFSALSVLVYLLVWIEYRRKNVQVGQGIELQEQLKQQRKLTISFGISCLCTLFLYIIPHRLGYFFWEQRRMLAYCGPAFICR